MLKQRLHPAAVVILLAKNIYHLLESLLPLIIIVASQGGQAIRWLKIIAPLALILYILWAVVYWWRYVYYIQDDELRVEYGIFKRKKTFIPLNRIQSVQLTAGILQRLLGLLSLEVETAGGGTKAEVSLSALSRENAEKLRQLLEVKKDTIGDELSNEPAIEYVLSSRDLLIAGSTSNGLLPMLAFLAAAFSQLDELIPNLYEYLEAFVGNISKSGVNAIILSVLFLLLVTWLISVGNVILKFGNFKLHREDDNIKISRGFLEQRQLTIPIKRIQAIKIIEGVVRGPLRLVSVEMINAAYAGKGGEANILFPLIRKKELMPFLAQVLPEFTGSLEVEALPRRSRPRYVLINIVPVLILSIILSIYAAPWGYLSWSLLPLAFLLGYVQHRDAGINIQGDMAVMRTRWLGMVTIIIPHRRVQSLLVSTSIFQQRKELQTVGLAIASGIGGARFKVKGVDKSKSRLMQDWLAGARFRQ